MTITEWARAYLALGWSIIPVDSRHKGGCPFPWKPYQTRLPTAEEIESWWGDRYPDHGIAIIMGAISGLVGIDLDRHGDDDGPAIAESVYGWEPDGLVVMTPGNGVHQYCKHPGGRVKNRTGAGAIAPGVELKGDGGFLYAPPSAHPSGGVYEWVEWPEELTALPEWATAKVVIPKDQIEASDPLDLALLNGVGRGERNDMAARVAGHYLSKGFSEADTTFALLGWNLKNTPPLGNKEIELVVASIARKEQLKRGATLKSLPDNTTTGNAAAGASDGVDEWKVAVAALSECFSVDILDIQWICGSEPVLRFTFPDDVTVEVPAASLSLQESWRRAVIRGIGRVPTKIGPKSDVKWDDYANQIFALGRAHAVNPGNEATDDGMLSSYVLSYIEGAPATEEGEVLPRPHAAHWWRGDLYVHLPTLRAHVRVVHDVKLKPKRLAQQARACGFMPRTRTVVYGPSQKRATRSFWAVPKDILQTDEG